MKRRDMLPGILNVSALQLLGAEMQSSARKRLIGVWKLLSIEVSTNGNVLYPYGEHPVGRLTYDDAGRTSAQLMKPGRRSSISNPMAISSAGVEELRQIADGYVGYFGTFTIDERNGIVVHHVEACTLPAWVGTDLKRSYQFIGAHLVLQSGPSKFSWERMQD